MPPVNINEFECAVQPASFLRTANAITSYTAHQTVYPIGVLLRLPNYDGMSLLQNLMYRDQGFERLYLIGKDRLTGCIESGQL